MDDDSENRWRKAANARWERFKKQQSTGDKKAKALAQVNKRPGSSGGGGGGAGSYPGVKRDSRIRKPVVLPQAGTFSSTTPSAAAAPKQQRKSTGSMPSGSGTAGADEDNPWRRAANARWEKHRLQSAQSTPGGPSAGPSRSTPRQQQKSRQRKDDHGAEGGLASVFDEETMGLEGEDLETFKKMCDSVFAKVNRLSSESRRLIKEFLAGQYDDDMSAIQHVVLNDEIVPHPEESGKYCRETLTLEMDYSKGKWRKIKRRWKNAIDPVQLQEAGIPFASDDNKGDDDGAGKADERANGAAEAGTEDAGAAGGEEEGDDMAEDGTADEVNGDDGDDDGADDENADMDDA